MSLSLKITSYQRLTPSQQATYSAESDSFTIGRNSSNDWAIPDPQRFLSGVHCRIHKQGDEYFITDTSTNGVFLNGSEQRLTRDDPVDLNAGDKFRIGDYEFEVLIDDESLTGNPFTSDDETMMGMDPFDEPMAPSEAPAKTDPFSEPGPFAADDPFADDDPFDSKAEKDDDYLKDINTPLSHLDESPLGKPVSIDSLMGFDDDEIELEETDSAEKLEQRQTPLNEAFKPSSIATPSEPTTTAPPVSSGSFASQGFDDFPDDWDETTGMLKIPEKDDSPATSDPMGFPDNWDEATGMLKIPVKPAPTKAPTPAKPPTSAPTTPAPRAAPPTRPAAPAVPPQAGQSGNAVAAFAKGAGLEIGQVSGIDQEILFEQVGRMLIMFTEGLIQTLGGRTHIKSEFRLDQTMIRPAENNPFKFSTSKTRTLLQLLSKSDPAYMTGANAIKEGFDDVNAHQMAVIAGMEAALQDILGRFNPKTLETRMVSDSIFDHILPGGKKAKYWDIFKILFDDIVGEAEDDFQQLFGREFSRAYEEQLSRLKNTD
jgi:type VI secretion system protein